MNNGLATTDIPASVLRIQPAAAYTSQALAFATARQPNVIRATLIVPSVRINCTSGEQGTVNMQISPDNIAAYVTIGSWTNRVAALLGAANDAASPATFIIPKGYYYKLVTSTTSGSPTYSLASLFELTI